MPITDNQNFLIEFVYYQDPNGGLTPLFGGNKTTLSWDGVGMPTINYLSDRGPNQHGRTIHDFRADERRLTFKIYETGCRRQDFWDNEHDLIDALRPNRSSTNATGYILIISPDNKEREIPARILRGPDGDWDGLGVTVPEDMNERLTFICDDPFWRDPTQQVNTFTVNPTTSCLPRCLPSCLGGTGLINTTTDIIYTGTWKGDTIDIVYTGPMVVPIVTNETSGKQIKLNYTISTGEAVTVSITPEEVTVSNNTGDNLIGTVDNISDLFDFALVTASDLTATGTNTIQVSASGGDANTNIQIKYYIRDISLYGA